jgi:hypothetical protein
MRQSVSPHFTCRPESLSDRHGDCTATASYQREAPSDDFSSYVSSRDTITPSANSILRAIFRTQCRSKRLSAQAIYAARLKAECGVFSDFGSKLRRKITEELCEDYSQVIQGTIPPRLGAPLSAGFLISSLRCAQIQ